MIRRTLGTSDLEVPAIAFGAWAIGGWWWGGSDDDRAVDALLASIDAGADAVDTAPIYGFGRSESVVARALARRPGKATVWTKCGLRWDDRDGRGEPFFEEPDGPEGRSVKVFKNSRPDSVALECDRSLARLGVEAIDLYQVHWPDSTTPIEETMGALLDLRAAGKVRAIGVSNYSVEQLERARAALGDVPLASDQPRYSLVHREAEADVLPWCREHEVGGVVYSPLAQGLLTGAVDPDRTFPPDDGRSRQPEFRRANRVAVAEMCEKALRPAADRLDATLGQVALAWTLARPGVTAAIAGARTAGQARENAAAGALELSAAEIAWIDREFAALELDLAP